MLVSDAERRCNPYDETDLAREIESFECGCSKSEFFLASIAGIKHGIVW